MTEEYGLLNVSSVQNGKISFKDFELVVGKTPFTSLWFLGSSVTAYFIILYILGQCMQNRPPIKVKQFSIFHNFCLAIFSAITAGGVLVELIKESHWPEHKDNPIEWCFCIPRGQHLVGPIYFWAYLYYLSKFYELIDSFLIIVGKSKKGLSFLHVIHHSSMMLFAYSWFVGNFGTMWLGVFLNSLVHAFMYTYYGFTSLGKRWRSRHWITIIQMIQFTLGTIYFIYFFIGRFFFVSNCSGNMIIMGSNLSFNLLFFYLFSQFYKEQYKKKSDKKSEPSLPSCASSLSSLSLSPLKKADEKKERLEGVVGVGVGKKLNGVNVCSLTSVSVGSSSVTSE